MLSKDNTVSRSRQLIDSKFPTWDVSTLNVFDTYLSRINPLDPQSSEVVFTKREYELLLGVSEMRPEQLNKSIRKFIEDTAENLIRHSRAGMNAALEKYINHSAKQRLSLFASFCIWTFWFLNPLVLNIFLDRFYICFTGRC